MIVPRVIIYTILCQNDNWSKPVDTLDAAFWTCTQMALPAMIYGDAKYTSFCLCVSEHCSHSVSSVLCCPCAWNSFSSRVSAGNLVPCTGTDLLRGPADYGSPEQSHGFISWNCMSFWPKVVNVVIRDPRWANAEASSDLHFSMSCLQWCIVSHRHKSMLHRQMNKLIDFTCRPVGVSFDAEKIELSIYKMGICINSKTLKILHWCWRNSLI